MSVTAFVVWAFIIHGVTQIVTLSSLFTPFRKFCARWQFTGALVICPMCFGTWVGMLLSLGGLSPVRQLALAMPAGFALPGGLLLPPSAAPAVACVLWGASVLFDGGLASGVAWFLHLISNKLGYYPPGPSTASPPPQTVYVQHLGLPQPPSSEVEEEPIASAAPTLTEAEAKG